MIKGVSFHDVVKIPDFSHCTPFDLLSPKMDSNVMPYLWKLGMDIDKHVIVQACKHRTMDSNVPVVGYRYVGQERQDKDWMDTKYASMSARIASQKDPHLAAEMVRMSAEGLNWSGYKAMVLAAMGQDGMTSKVTKDEVEEDYEEVVATLKVLISIQESIRGPLGPDENILKG